MIILLPIAVTSIVLGRTWVEDDGYLPPPITSLDQVATLERVHFALGSMTYLRAAKDRDCHEICDVFERGFVRARAARITKPSQCVDEYEAGLWSQTEYQEGYRAYALKVIELMDETRRRTNEGNAS